MGKRKRADHSAAEPAESGDMTSELCLATEDAPSESTETITVQIVAGSYERILHGITATIPPTAPPLSDTSTDGVSFADTFLFNAHASAIRCLALSPPTAPVPNQLQKVILASGSTDERINLYHLSLHPPPSLSKPASKENPLQPLLGLGSNPVSQNPQNRELGSLLHHSSTITSLCFPTRSKLLSSAEDSTITVTRTRDWSLLSTIKAPIPKPHGRPSGDTAPPGGIPAGINDFAVHPSMKMMISVSKGEKCMRLWNLVTGKKAGVLNFGREILSGVGEGRWGVGEGRRVLWGGKDGSEEFCVGWELGGVVFGLDSKPKCRVQPSPLSKIHQMQYVALQKLADIKEESVLAVSTEDGRILFYSTSISNLQESHMPKDAKEERSIPSAKLLAQVGGKKLGLTGRIKDFTILPLPSSESSSSSKFLIVTAGSDGIIRLWTLLVTEIQATLSAKGISEVRRQEEVKQVGRLIGIYETRNRITCMVAFIMVPLDSGRELAEEKQVAGNGALNEELEDSSNDDSK